MAKHTWLLRPTQERADRLLAAYSIAWDEGCGPTLAACFAGYCVELHQQGSGPSNNRLFLANVAGRGYRFSKGRNAEHYRVTFRRHLHLLRDALAPWLLIPTARSLNLSNDAPWWVIRDRLLDQGEDNFAATLEELFDDE